MGVLVAAAASSPSTRWAALKTIAREIHEAERTIGDPTKKRGIRAEQKIAAWDHRYLMTLLSI